MKGNILSLRPHLLYQVVQVIVTVISKCSSRRVPFDQLSWNKWGGEILHFHSQGFANSFAKAQTSPGSKTSVNNERSLNSMLLRGDLSVVAKELSEELEGFEPHLQKNINLLSQNWIRGRIIALPPEAIWKSLKNYLKSRFRQGYINTRNPYVFVYL